MKKDFLDYLEDIIHAMSKAEEFSSGLQYELFAGDDLANFATVRALEIIGEATKRIPQEICDEYPEIPWSEMARMRDRLIHGYDNVDLDLVWQVIKNRIPHVKPLLQQILDDYKEKE